APIARASLRESLDGVRDLERLATKAALGRSTPRELSALGRSVSRLPDVRVALRDTLGDQAGSVLLRECLSRWDDCGDVYADIRSTLVDDAPIAVGEDATIATGVDAELDDLRALRDGGRDAIARIQADERGRTGIQSLKVGFNKVFGYYIEVTKSNLHLVPSDYQRRQTITNGERFVTPALKEYEARVLTATERIETRERELFETLRASVGQSIAR